MTRPRPTVDLGYPTEPHGRIPAFNSIEEEAEFWDTHDMAEFDEEFEPAVLRRRSNASENLVLRLDDEDRDELNRRAEEEGVEPLTLVRMWIKEHLHKEAS